MADDPLRTRAARAAAERALIRVVHHYGARPEFVVLGGLVPDLLCSHSPFLHSGTTDVDVQVNLEIAAGSVNAVRLERALRNAEFEPDEHRVWRWKADGTEAIAVIKFELLADLDDQRSGSTIVFDGCESLGAANLRGTGFAVRDIEARQLRARVGGVEQTAEINVTGIAGFLLAKCAAAHSRRKPKDWYDIAYVLLHNDAGGPGAAAAVVLNKFAPTCTVSERRSTIFVTTSATLRPKAPRPTPTRWNETTNTSTVVIYSAKACRRSMTSIACSPSDSHSRPRDHEREPAEVFGAVSSICHRDSRRQGGTSAYESRVAPVENRF